MHLEKKHFLILLPIVFLLLARSSFADTEFSTYMNSSVTLKENIELMILTNKYSYCEPENVTMTSPSANSYVKGVVTINITSTEDDINASFYYSDNLGDPYKFSIGTNDS